MGMECSRSYYPLNRSSTSQPLRNHCEIGKDAIRAYDDKVVDGVVNNSCALSYCSTQECLDVCGMVGDEETCTGSRKRQRRDEDCIMLAFKTLRLMIRRWLAGEKRNVMCLVCLNLSLRNLEKTPDFTRNLKPSMKRGGQKLGTQVSPTVLPTYPAAEFPFNPHTNSSKATLSLKGH
ncbi:unnamed protein product [Brassica oleracea]|uniref:(rape) hypothetical protein n=1 Tax=Brassica napus TaxID=3708 RepID=A0A816RE43_BRANA|nr:unnamed protein product [Brassica napus]